MTDAKSKELKIEHVSVDELIPYAKNARTHSDTQIAQIASGQKRNAADFQKGRKE